LQCAESALESFIGDLSHTYFVGNAPMGHMVIQPTEDKKLPSIKVCTILIIEVLKKRTVRNSHPQAVSEGGREIP